MWKQIAIMLVLFMGITSVINGQTKAKSDASGLLKELGSMLKEIPETKEECQTLLRKIKEWQEKKLKELEGTKVGIRITEPSDQSQVPNRPEIKGTVSDPSAKVWVVVHPTEVSDYYVQPGVTARDDGTWKTTIYIGRPGGIDVGKHFEVMAFANPTIRLKEGDILSGWPEAQWKSQVIEITRK
ncbi:MAG: hypothetical protein HYZ34_12680 [Ignavibacteriae bacterium]|nr:hypothetical protein [Ignavibacteriota bacterium]